MDIVISIEMYACIKSLTWREYLPFTKYQVKKLNFEQIIYHFQFNAIFEIEHQDTKNIFSRIP